MNLILALILFIIVGGTAFDLGVEFLNIRALRAAVPEEFRDICDPARHEKTIAYQRENFRFSAFRQCFFALLLAGFILAGGFNWVDHRARGFAAALGAPTSPIVQGLFFVAILALLRGVFQLPFAVYGTFVIEERFGFNRTTPRTFVLDIIRGVALGTILGAPVVAGLIAFFEKAGRLAWVYSWAAVSGFQLVLLFLAPALILPLFNRFTPLPAGELDSAVRAYSRKANFKLQGVFTMDSSRRSTKGNAFFTGFGRFRRLVLFDSLIEKHTVDELVAIFAHEVGHYKLGHIPRSIALSIASSGILFYVLSLFIGTSWGDLGLTQGFRMDQASIYGSLVFVGFIYSPISRLLSIAGHYLSRKAEFEADRYSVKTFGKPAVMADALKKLSAENLSHLTPHPLKVFLDYTHPPVLARIRALQEGQTRS